jgi:predicted alpha/beta-hydrolase family hydrolase
VSPLVLLAPGAGLPSSSPWMTAWAERLGAIGIVEPFDYDYVRNGKRRPDPLPKLIARHRAALDDALLKHGARPVVLAGKSMGSRVGCHLANVLQADDVDVRALVCFGYPLVGQNGKRRDEVLRELRTPILFVQGTRDELCPLGDLEEVRRAMAARSALHVVETGDHSLQVTRTHTKTTGRTQEDEDRAALDAIRAFLAGP